MISGERNLPFYRRQEQAEVNFSYRMPFKGDSPFSNVDLEGGNEVRKPLLEPQVEADVESPESNDGNEVQKPLLEPQVLADVERPESNDVKVEDSGEDHEQHHLVKHVHFSESLQRVLEKKELDEEQGLNKDNDEEEDEEDEDFLEVVEFWEWVKAEVKCYARYICPVVLVNACILLLVILYYSTWKS